VIQEINELIHFDGEAPGPVSAEIEDNRVVAFRVKDGKIGIGERCDGFFAVWLDPNEFDQFLSELQALRRTLDAAAPVRR
jgi:hypothetical protein